MNPLNALEIDLLLQLNRLWACPALDAAATALDRLGDKGRIFILAAIVLMCFRQTRIFGALLATALIIDALAVNVTIKPMVARARPYNLSSAIQLITAPPGDFSFPSGHTAVAFAAAAALRPAGKRAHIAALALGALMGLSRLYLMVHYPTDVLLGAVAGYLCGMLAVYIWKRYTKYSTLLKNGR